MTHRTTSTMLTALLSVALLAGCTTDGGEPTPSDTPLSAPDGASAPAWDNACDGSQAVLSGDGSDHDLSGGCTAVSVVSSGSSVTLGPTDDLVVEGSNNEITATELGTVTFLGTNNRLHVEGDQPEVDDQGGANTVD